MKIKKQIGEPERPDEPSLLLKSYTGNLGLARESGVPQALLI